MSLTGSLSDLQISIPFFVPSVSEQGPGLGSGGSQGGCEPGHAGGAGAGAARGPWGAPRATPEPPQLPRAVSPLPPWPLSHPSPLASARRGEPGKALVGEEVISL